MLTVCSLYANDKYFAFLQNNDFLTQADTCS